MEISSEVQLSFTLSPNASNLQASHAWVCWFGQRHATAHSLSSWTKGPFYLWLFF